MAKLLTERLEVRLNSRQMRLLQEAAKARGVSMGRLVREAIDRLLAEDLEQRQLAAEELFRVGAPVGDWEEMEREIENSHLR